MTKSASISARIDPNLKRKAEAIFSELELTASQAIALFYRQVINKQGIPFELTVHGEANGANGHQVASEIELPTDNPVGAIVEQGLQLSNDVNPEHAAILKERENYEALHAEIWKQYPHEYVAVYQGKVVDHDKDKVALIVRRREKYAGKSVLITQVEEIPEGKTLHFRSPKLVSE